jgi:hypothetical protein
VLPVPRLCEFYPGICLATEEKAQKNLSEGKKNLNQINKHLRQCTVHVLPIHPLIHIHTHAHKQTHTHTNTHPHKHTLQNNIITVDRGTKCTHIC